MKLAIDGKLCKNQQHKVEKILKAIWPFKRKHDPDGCFYKCEARIFLHADFWGACSNVDLWMTICLLFTFCGMFNLASMSIEFTQVFPEADINSDVLVGHLDMIILMEIVS